MGGGPGIGDNVFLGAQNATYTWAEYWGETGPMLTDEEGTALDSGMVEYSYLGGKVVHYKLPGAAHTLGEYTAKVYEMIKESIIGSDWTLEPTRTPGPTTTTGPTTAPGPTT